MSTLVMPAPRAVSLAAFGPTVLRLALGAMWLSHGLVLKLMTFGIAGLAGWLASVGLPPALAWPLTLAEIAGGVLILLGWHGRWVSLVLLPILLGATAIHAGNGWVFTSANGGWEYPLFLLAASLAHVLMGDGAFALRGVGSR
ncbi:MULTISPECIES: DoxX family protein [Piscinibacter]|uniref:DoxX family protein n=1 Tax=Piscinibacter TaxID=1114981 RepID=UPI001F0BB0FA|nr:MULTISPECIES: DoxX family protein [Piscinibacter]